ncbi:MAG: PHB depolymerase family esterase [Betaproteobacteria bacterium]
MNRTIQESMRLMQAGDLMAATRALQSGLSAATSLIGDREFAASDAKVGSIKGEFRVVAGSDDDHPDDAHVRKPSVADPGRRSIAEFSDHHFTCAAGTLAYKLFIPVDIIVAEAPLLVMLHGCTQSPDDFARGTRMNARAQEKGYIVAYPAQGQGKNAGKCWNWFRDQDQQRDHGEPALLAALTRDVVNTLGLDPERVVVAGLSAGGAMAAILADTYPDLYAAVGVHSGLARGAARDLPSAYAAMRQAPGAPAVHIARTRNRTVPAIVFHGDRDTTVHPGNGDALVAQRIDAFRDDGPMGTVERGSTPGGRTYTRTVFRHADRGVVAEQWIVHGAAHAWSGGDPAGSYTDAAGPDASEHMLRFFSDCPRRRD